MTILAGLSKNIVTSRESMLGKIKELDLAVDTLAELRPSNDFGKRTLVETAQLVAEPSQTVKNIMRDLQAESDDKHLGNGGVLGNIMERGEELQSQLWLYANTLESWGSTIADDAGTAYNMHQWSHEQTVVRLREAMRSFRDVTTEYIRDVTVGSAAIDYGR